MLGTMDNIASCSRPDEGLLRTLFLSLPLMLKGSSKDNMFVMRILRSC